MDLLWIAGGVLALVFLAAVGSRLRRERTPIPRDLDDEDSVLAEVEIYEAYGRVPQAIELLREALAKKPDSTKYRRKINELKANQRGT